MTQIALVNLCGVLFGIATSALIILALCHADKRKKDACKKKPKRKKCIFYEFYSNEILNWSL